MKKGIITYENKISTLNNTIAEKEKNLIGKRKDVEENADDSLTQLMSKKV